MEIYFTDIEKVLQKKHTLDEKELSVTIHEPLLAKKITCSENFVKERVVGVDPDIMSFLYKNTPEKLTELQTTCGLKMNWESGSSMVTLVPTKEQSKTSQWEESCEKFTAFISTFITRTIAMSPEAWEIFQEKSRELCQSHQDKVNITMSPDNYQTVVIGEQQDVEEVVQQLEDMKTNIEQEIKFEASKVTDEIKDIPRNKLLLLDSWGLKEKLQQQHKDLEMDIFPEMGFIQFRGPQVVLHKANLAVWQSLSKIKEVTVELPHTALDLLKTEPGQFHIMKKFEGHSVEAIVVYENDGKANEAVVLGSNQQHAKKAVGLLKGAIEERSLPLTEEQVQMEKSQKWHRFKDAILDKRLLTITFEESSSTICLVGAKEDVQAAFEEISGFFKENTIVSKILPLPPGSTRFLFKHVKDKVDAIQQKFKSHSVLIKESKEVDEGVMVSGTAEGAELAMKKLQDVSASISQKTLKIDKPGMRKFFNEGKGVKLLSLVENEHKCIIDLNCAARPATTAPVVSEEGHKETVKECECSYTTPENKKILVFKDDLTKHCVDVIVNAANSTLKHVGGLAKAVVEVGGKKIQEECEKFIIEHGPLLDGQVAVTASGNLPCKRIVHAVGPKWEIRGLHRSKGKKTKEEKHLHFAVMNALKEAKDFRSIAIPAISTGIYGFPRDLCAKIMMDAALEFSEKNPGSSLSEIHFTDTDDASIKEMVKEMTTRFKDDPSFLDSSKMKIKGIGEVKGGRKAKKASMTSSSHRAPATKEEQPTWHGDPNTVLTPQGVHITMKIGDLSKEKVGVVIVVIFKGLAGARTEKHTGMFGLGNYFKK